MPEPHPDGQHIAHASARLAWVLLEGEALTRLSPMLEADRARAVADLEAENRFAPIASATGIAGLRDAEIGAGPFGLHLSIQEGRLVLDIRRNDDARLGTLALALGPFRRLIKDYQLLVDSYLTAVQDGREARIQAIDMGRRGLHNEGAELLARRLKGRVAIDFATARRLFTLVCVLHQRI
ncbi:MAG TPA: UPF0262 family protein [Acetobacteraceae bacterium]|jgi:uncharacterized protein (UPF0262 family)|nr:UPF0262 family protein [Acetobacteraceae bacterium]